MDLGEAMVALRTLKYNFGDPRYDGDDDGTGGICCNCDRYFRTNVALDAHQAYCSRLLRGRKEAGVAYEEPNEEETWLDGLILEDTALDYARICLKHLNQQSDTKYKLAKPGNYQIANISGGPIVHLNFRAKPDDGPVETFFAQLKSPLGFLNQKESVHCVVSLGTNIPLPTWGSEHDRDCIFCDFPVLHPSPRMEGCEGLILGDPMEERRLDYVPRISRKRMEMALAVVAKAEDKFMQLQSHPPSSSECTSLWMDLGQQFHPPSSSECTSLWMDLRQQVHPPSSSECTSLWMDLK